MKSTGWGLALHTSRGWDDRLALGGIWDAGFTMIGSCRPCASSGGLLVDAARDVHRQCPPGKNAMKHNANCPPPLASCTCPSCSRFSPPGKVQLACQTQGFRACDDTQEVKLGSIGKVFREPRLVVDRLSPVSRVSSPSPAPLRPLQPPNAGRGVFSQWSIWAPQP